jgi:hypothetical protein
MSLPPPPAKAGEITMTATAAPKSKLFMGLSPLSEMGSSRIAISL